MKHILLAGAAAFSIGSVARADDLTAYMEAYSSDTYDTCEAGLDAAAQALSGVQQYSSPAITFKFFKEDVLREVDGYVRVKAKGDTWRTGDRLRAYRIAGDAGRACGQDADSMGYAIFSLR